MSLPPQLSCNCDNLAATNPSRHCRTPLRDRAMPSQEWLSRGGLCPLVLIRSLSISMGAACSGRSFPQLQLPLGQERMLREVFLSQRKHFICLTFASIQHGLVISFSSQSLVKSQFYPLLVRFLRPLSEFVYEFCIVMGFEAQPMQPNTLMVSQLRVSATYGTGLRVWLVGRPEPRVLCSLTAFSGR